MTKPLISIISAVRNQKDYIKEMLDSVSSQESNNFEHIIIEGESSDNTMQLINKYKKENNNKYSIQVFTYPPKGIAEGINRGILKAQGQFILILHGDDYLSDSKATFKMQQSIANNKTDRWIIGRDIRLKKGVIYKYSRKFLFKFTPLFSFTNFLPHASMLISKRLHDRLGLYSEKYKIGLDYEFIKRLLFHRIRPKFVDLEFAIFRVHNAGKSSNTKNKWSNFKEGTAIRWEYFKKSIKKKTLLQKTIKFVDNAYGKKKLHFERTVYWLLQLKPDADEAMQIAAYAHDVERAFKQKKATDPQRFPNQKELIQHQKACGKIISEFLRNEGAALAIINKVQTLVSNHEFGGDNDKDHIMNADSISYLENNAERHINTLTPLFGKQKTKQKIDWIFKRISDKKAREIAEPMYEKAKMLLNKN